MKLLSSPPPTVLLFYILCYTCLLLLVDASSSRVYTPFDHFNSKQYYDGLIISHDDDANCGDDKWTSRAKVVATNNVSPSSPARHSISSYMSQGGGGRDGLLQNRRREALHKLTLILRGGGDGDDDYYSANSITTKDETIGDSSDDDEMIKDDSQSTSKSSQKTAKRGNNKGAKKSSNKTNDKPCLGSNSSDHEEEEDAIMLQQYYASINNNNRQQHENLKRGTRTTGSGASKRNPSIFASTTANGSNGESYYSMFTAAALSGDVLNRSSNSAESQPSKSNSKSSKKQTRQYDIGSSSTLEEKNPMMGRLWVQKLHSDGSLIFKFPSRIKSGKSSLTSYVRLSEESTSSSNGSSSSSSRGFESRNDDAKKSITIHAEYLTTNQKQHIDIKNFIPIEAIYGIYNLPYSGPHVVLITESEEVYTSPPSPLSPREIIIGDISDDSTGDSSSSINTSRNSPLLELRRIKSMEIVSLRDDDQQTRQNQKSGSNKNNPTEDQMLEERRQLKLLRKSFKEHDLYFTVPSPPAVVSHYNDEKEEIGKKRAIVHDVTHSLQRSFVEWMTTASREKHDDNVEDADSNRWWIPYMSRSRESTDKNSRSGQQSRDKMVVDPRFFWNEKPALSLLPPKADEDNDSQAAATTISSPYALLLDHVIPVTSAFVGVQRNIPIPSTSSTTQGSPTSEINEKYDQLLISRRSKYRTGTRFTRRGADDTGAVANYAETEQICFIVRDNCEINTSDNDSNSSRTATATNNDNRELLEVYSHVQTRGSIPLHWSSPATVTEYRPRVYIGVDPIVQARGLRDHLLGELACYSPSSSSSSPLTLSLLKPSRTMSRKKNDMTKIAMVNLIDKHGDQGRLGNAFDSVLSAVLDVYDYDSDIDVAQQPILGPNSVEHIWYDFHAECKGGRWDRLSQLLEQVMPTLNTHRYFSAVPTTEDDDQWEILSLQDGVVRTNCMDCLDRTNVVQSMFGRYVLYRQLHERLGLTKTNNNNGIMRRFRRRRTLPLEHVVGYKQRPLTLPWMEGEAAHRYLWADNADAISRLYAGTPALKGDFTRTGERTKRGAIDDGVNSLSRYYINNFIDADRQEGMDLLVCSAEFNLMPHDMNDESSRILMLQELANRSKKRRGYNESHRRIKVEPDDAFGSRDDEQIQLWDLRYEMKREAQRSRSPLSPAAREENLDAPTSSDFLLQVTSSAGDEVSPIKSSVKPWWVSSSTNREEDKSDTDQGQTVGNLNLPETKLKGSNLIQQVNEKYILGGKRAAVTSFILLLKAPILTAAVIAAVVATEFGSRVKGDGDS